MSGPTLVMWLYPRHLRREYGREIMGVVRALRAEPRHRGAVGALRLGIFLLRDSVATLARQRAEAMGVRSTPRYAPPGVPAVPYADALIAALGVLALYVATLAPTVAFWDTGEYLTAAHVQGIPHQPGNPLFVITAHYWERLLLLFGLTPAVAINLYSAVLSASAHFFWYLVAFRMAASLTTSTLLQRAVATAGVLLSATAFTVWNQSNVNEKVYTFSLLTVALVSWLVLRWSETKSARWLVGIVFVLSLSATNHLMGVLVAPAVLVFILMRDARVLLKPRVWAAAAVAAALGLTPQFFLPYRGAQRPVMNQNEIVCAGVPAAAASIYSWGRAGCQPLSAAIQREQYGERPITVDPTVYPDQVLPRSPYLVSRQLINYAQYFNWQWARSIGGNEPLVGGWRPLVTLLFVFLGWLGARAHWRRQRASAAYIGVLFLTLSIGLVIYLNFEYGYSIAHERIPEVEYHEVRERDYFFLISFSVWALWAGAGLLVAWEKLRARFEQQVRRPALAAAPVFALALLPLALNWSWASRANDYTARDWAYNVLMSVDPYGVLFTNGDNDTFPLWYLQEVEGIRRDVTVMVTGYLNTDWYARQVRDLTTPCKPGESAELDPTRIICQRTYQADQMPGAIRTTAQAPAESILPLSDDQIAQIVATPFVTQEPLKVKAGAIESTIAAGTVMLPADTFVAAIVQATIDERPIHFTTPSPPVQKLGLADYTVRQGLTFKLSNGAVTPSASVVAMPPDQSLSPVTGAFLDLAATERRFNEVFRFEGRIMDPDAPFVDRAVTNIMLQYTWAYVSVAQAHALLGNQAAAQASMRRAEWWQQRTD